MRPTAAIILLLVGASACRGETVPVIQPRLMEVPFHGEARAGEDPMNQVRSLHGRIEAELLKLASADGAKVAVGRDQYGARGERLLISAITPEKGYFALVPLGVYEEDSAVGIARKSGGKVPVCRFELAWDSLPESFSVAGLMWASRLFPTTDCNPTRLQPGAKLLDWEKDSNQASYSVAARNQAAGLGTKLVAENFPASRALQPVNLKRAMESALVASDRIESIVPLPGFPAARAFAKTRSGKSLMAMSASDGVTGCIVEGLSWEAAADRFGAARRAGENLCASLLADWKKRETDRLMRDAETNPPTLTPVDRN